MINISSENIGKKFRNEWVFRNLNFNFSDNQSIAITGPNGSGKSTLMQALAGIIPVNEGKIEYFSDMNKISDDKIHQNISFSSPYLELIEEFTLSEAVNFHINFKPLSYDFGVEKFLELIELEKHAKKQIKYFSSGMKQRLKLALAFYCNSQILFLDEPTSNLDAQGFDWYLKRIDEIQGKKLILVSSNEPKEYTFCINELNILNFKS